MAYDEYNPPPHVVQYVENILSIVDEDIAEPFRQWIPGHFDAKLPLLTQIARSLRIICANMEHPYVNVDNGDYSQNNGANSNNQRESSA